MFPSDEWAFYYITFSQELFGIYKHLWTLLSNMFNVKGAQRIHFYEKSNVHVLSLSFVSMWVVSKFCERSIVVGFVYEVLGKDVLDTTLLLKCVCQVLVQWRSCCVCQVLTQWFHYCQVFYSLFLVRDSK
jgi:hypothetical protein